MKIKKKTLGKTLQNMPLIVIGIGFILLAIHDGTAAICLLILGIVVGSVVLGERLLDN